MSFVSRSMIVVGFLVVAFAANAVLAGPADREVALRSGLIEPGRATQGAQAGESGDGPERWIVRFRQAPGWHEKGAVQTAGARVNTPLPGQAYLVSVPAGQGGKLSQIPGVDWAVPYLPQDKVAPEISGFDATMAGDTDVVVLLHLFPDADATKVAAELTEAGMRVEGAKNGNRFDRIVLMMTPGDVEARRDELAERTDVFWVERRHRRVLFNDTSIWVGQSGLYAGQTTPVLDRGLVGTGQIAAVLDTGIDADACYFWDDTEGLPITNTGSGTAVNPAHRKILAVDFLDPSENPADPTHWDTQGHGTHVAGILAGDTYTNPGDHDQYDGMALGAKLVIQDAGYAADDCGDLPGIGCPVTDLVPIFQQAYDQGARVHSNSWGDQENAAVTNVYTDASQDADEFMWNNPDFLIVFAAGNRALGGVGTLFSPSTAKNCISTGGTFKGESAEYLSDISVWGPTDDGRIKPDVVFPSASIRSSDNNGDVTTPNCGNSGFTGTSMAAPGVAGNALIVREYFMNGWYPTGAKTPANGFTPTAALIKAMIVNSGTKIGWDAEGRPIEIPGNEQGWGRVLMDDALHFASDARGLWIGEHAGFTSPGDPDVVYMLEMEDTGEPLKITLAWTDYPSTPAAATHLVNDLDLRVDGASSGFMGNNFNHSISVTGGSQDRLNNLEQILIPNPEPGVYSIRISAHAIPSGPQPFALVVTGGQFSVTAGPLPSYWTHAVDDSGPNGNGDGVLDPGETAKIPVTLWNAGDAAATTVLGQLYSAFPDTLKVYDAVSSYADMPVGAQAGSTVPHYEVTLEPSASCGQVLGATMGVSGDGFQTGTAFTLDIGEYEHDYPSTDTPLTIPRGGQVNSYINVPVSFPVTDVTVTLDIDQSDISDLEVLFYPAVLTEPPVYLHNNTGAGTSGIHTTYDTLTEPDGPGDLESFNALDPQGNWRLKIVNSGNKTGTLQGWTIHMKSDVPYDCNPVGCGEGVPSAVGDTLTVNKSGASDVQVGWSGVGSSDYNVWRSEDPLLKTATHAGASGGATSLIDGGAQSLPGVHFYVVRSVNSCRWESD